MLLKDAINFVRHSLQVASQSSPHIYVSALAFAPKSSEIAQVYAPRFRNILGLEIGRLDVWPAKQTTIRSHSDRVNFVAFSPDGKSIVSCSGSSFAAQDCSTRICDVETGQILCGPFTEHRSKVICAVYSINNKNILSISTDNTIQTLNTDLGVVNRPVKQVTVAVGQIEDCVAFSHSRKYVASSCSQYTTNRGQAVSNVIVVTSVETGSVVAGPFVGHKDAINCLSFSPDDSKIASGSDDTTVCIWDTKTSELMVGPLEGHQGWILSISYSHNGTLIASGTEEGTVQLWDVKRTSSETLVFDGHTGPVMCVAFSGDDSRIVVGSGDRTVWVWALDTEEVVAGPFKGHNDWITSVAFSPDYKRVVSGSVDGTVRIWDVEVDKTIDGLPDGHKDGILSIASSKDCRYIVSGSKDKTIRIWDMKTGRLVAGPFKGHEGAVNAVVYSPDGRRVASGSTDKTVRVWDVATGEVVVCLRGHLGRVFSVAYSNNGRYIASGSWDGTNRIWNAETGEHIRTFQAGVREQPSLAFSPDDKLIVSDSPGGFRIWDIETGGVVTESGDFGTNSTTFSHDGKLIVTGSDTIQVWDARTGELVAGPFGDNIHRVNSVAFSPDDKFIVSGSSDSNVHVWDTKTGQSVMGPFKGHTLSVNSVAFSHNGKYIISASNDKTIRIWSIEPTRSMLYTNDSEVDDDGWVKGKGGLLLFWVPLHHRFCLHRPSNTRIIGPNETRLDFTNARWGEDWASCFTP